MVQRSCTGTMTAFSTRGTDSSTNNHHVTPSLILGRVMRSVRVLGGAALRSIPQAGISDGKNKTMAYQIEVDFSLYVWQACNNRLAQKSDGTRRQREKSGETDEKKDC